TAGTNLGGSTPSLLEIGGQRCHRARQFADFVATPEQSLVCQGLIRVLARRPGQPLEWTYKSAAKDERQHYRKRNLVDRHLQQLVTELEQTTNPASGSLGQVHDPACAARGRQGEDHRLPCSGHVLGEDRFSPERPHHLFTLLDRAEGSVDLSKLLGLNTGRNLFEDSLGKPPEE